MSVAILEGLEDGAFLYDTVSGLPLHTRLFTSREHAVDFLRWYAPADPRRMSPSSQRSAYDRWYEERLDSVSGELLPENAVKCPSCGGTGGNVSGPDGFGNYHTHHDCGRCDGDGIILSEGQPVA